jgi:NTP pyrophosphatase (non-canonical NTP hydrolase)
MTEEKYIKQVKRTLVDLGSQQKNLRHLAMGISTELNEILDIFKKKFAYSKDVDINHLAEEIGDTAWYSYNLFNILEKEDKENFEFQPMGEFESEHSKEKLKEFFEETITPGNINDAMEGGFYAIRELLLSLCFVYDLDYIKVLQTNIDKLKERYPDKFDAEKAINRDLKKENKVLNKKD